MAKEAGGPPTPSDAAVRRLHSGLQEGIASYTHDIHADVDEIARAVADDREDEALRVVREHIERLEVFADEVRRVVAGAAVEREAEAVLDDLVVQGGTPPPPDTSRRARHVGAAAGRALAAAASIVVIALLTVGAPAPADPLLAAVVASEEVQAAVGAASGSAESIARLSVVTADLRTAIADLDRQVLADPEVRQRLQVMLADHQQSLAALSSRMPQAGRMLQELRDLADQLQLDLPPISTAGRATPVPAPSTTLPTAGGLDDLLPDGVLPDLPPLPTPSPALPDASAPDGSAPPPHGDAPAPDDVAPAPDDPTATDDDPPSAADPATPPPAPEEPPPTEGAPPAGGGGDVPALPPGSGGLDDAIGDGEGLGTAAPPPSPSPNLPSDLQSGVDAPHTDLSELLQP